MRGEGGGTKVVQVDLLPDHRRSRFRFDHRYPVDTLFTCHTHSRHFQKIPLFVVETRVSEREREMPVVDWSSCRRREGNSYDTRDSTVTTDVSDAHGERTNKSA